ncbi:MAG: hypothetical protein M1133_10495 [Armatimonadetes bacterium]|nr:hypothetical protein [Armatimonadota bacterium]
MQNNPRHALPSFCILHSSFFILVILLIISTLTGCAKFPTTAPTTGKQLVVTLKVRGAIRPTDPADPSATRYYFIAIDNDADSNTGPLAALFPPYGGTGWVTSQDAARSIGVTSFLEYDAANPQGYIYGVLPGSFFLNRTPPQPPIRYELLEGGTAIRFVIDFSQIATAAIPVDQIRELDLNIITTNRLPNGNEIVENRQIDGLGPSGQDYVTIDTTTDRTYSDDDIDASNFTLTDPDLDIVSWTVSVQTVSSR